MARASDVIAALTLRRRHSLRPEEPLELPRSWNDWAAAGPALDPAQADAMVAPLAARAPRQPPPRAAELSGWQAFRRLFWQGWEPAPRDERGIRWFSRIADVLLHIVLVGMLLYLMYLRFMMPPAPPEDSAIEVEFIGRGNPQTGGAAASQQAMAAAAAAPTAASASSSTPAATATPVPPSPSPAPAAPATADAQPAPQPQIPAAQPLQVTEVPAEPEPETYRLPPPRERSIETPQMQMRVPERRVAIEDVPVLETKPVRELQAKPAQQTVRAPQLREQVRELDTPQAMPQVQARATPTTTAATPAIRVPATRAGVGEIPMPAATTGTASATAGQGQGNSERGTSASPGASTRPAQGDRGVAASGSGAGPATRPAPGGWQGPAKSDDWGASARNRAGDGSGERPGVLGDDGRARLPDAWSEQTVVDFDRAGQWLKRPGLEYRGTRFDEYWIPQGTLLQEWVRRGIKKVKIPIPGSKRHLECVVSILQLGGGCFPVNPDANEQPARARKPPDIPFKRELQEDNGSVPPPAGG